MPVGQLGSRDLEWGWLPRKRPRRRSLRQRSWESRGLWRDLGLGKKEEEFEVELARV